MSPSRPDPIEESRGLRSPPREKIMAQMGKILSSPDFAQSDRSQKFLRFVVEEALAGRAETLKEYTIALAVFERDESFDPQTSSIVRVEANRLRGKLKKYNAIDGRDDPVRIEIPRGTYVPSFETAGQQGGSVERRPDSVPPGRARKPRPWSLVALLATLIVTVGTGAFFLLDTPFLNLGAERSSESPNPERMSSVAVLPLRNLSGEADQDYFSDGMTDALITSLAKQDGVRVISFISAMAYKSVNRPIAEIARELNVTHVIEGAVLRSGNRIRITAQLVDAANDRHLWAESYERDVVDVLVIQDEVVRQIVSSLKGQIVPAKNKSPKGTPAIDPAAYEAQLKGRFFLNKLTEEGFRKGIAYFKQAVEIAPDYAAAYSGLATCYCLLAGYGFELVDPREGMPAAKNAVMEALRLDDSLAEPHAFLGIVRLKYEWDWPGAEEAFKRSIQINPSYAQARVSYSFYLQAMGRQEEAIREAEEARSIDPLSPAANINLGWQYLQADRPERARQQFESTAELDPYIWGVHWGLGHYHRRNGAYDKAIAAFQKAIDTGGGHVLPLTALGYTYAISGQPEKARKVLDKLEGLAKESYVSPFGMATIYAGLGLKDDAFTWLEKAFEHRSRSMVWLKVDRDFDGLRSDARFQALLRRIGLSE